jgi:hypothetical protein
MRLPLLTAIAAVAIAVPAAASDWQSYSLYNGSAPVEGGSGTHSARLSTIVLPESFKVRKGKTRLTFGPFGACRSTGTITPVLVHSTATTSAAVLAEQVQGGTTYGEGTRGGASYRVAKFSGDRLRGAWVGRTRLAETWIVIRVITTPHRSCHTGGVRESLGYPLTDAFGTTRASGY